MTWLTDPFSVDFMVRALVGGSLAAVLCAVVGTWVLVRGMAFLGEALSHGMLPGVAIATLTGIPPVLGAAVSAGVMVLGVGALRRRARLSYDTSIGLLFVGMLALGVIIVSSSRSFATDVTAILFGDVLAVTRADVGGLAITAAVAMAVAVAFHRPFTALAFDTRKATTLGLHPRLAEVVLIGLVTLAVVASYRAVGTLLVVGLLLAPAAAARAWTRHVASTMLLGAGIGAAAVLVGLLVSWHAGTAAGASIAAVAVGSVVVSRALAVVVLRRTPIPTPARAAAPAAPRSAAPSREGA
ncbi:zinc ABC transporter permease AztB [Curtobacterium flaccumfaciens]|uniref:zinc ABC transporter permease AztB n=1 Tax=Curtobacterium flaccumfaciens TaxID=2035 RepID=UPI001BDE232D|nr:zinc ABC transporter permease AztB [Curtobacterium flaccumfaciens]MBT1607260.1 metal ABC transporter permease [Curtobacterium flaccumfaciens pv. betae]MBT1656779.1 metal ABC transporter permease [Curtobacterium flaccumfaciens pv. betae]MCS0472527.1 metal ABC transporter permease [Curtobacterium flaccumfaciens pv. betae]MCS0476105.1 metal ABC transporter permease [Curtobacterium flaccumfaciens pv. betae]MCS0479267.1 metal ABC transporter permease [Curtobacterium flaccumfaciens pv. betae]